MTDYMIHPEALLGWIRKNIYKHMPLTWVTEATKMTEEAFAAYVLVKNGRLDNPQPKWEEMLMPIDVATGADLDRISGYAQRGERSDAEFRAALKSSTTPSAAVQPQDNESRVDYIAKLIADKCGNGMREKYEDVARKIVEAIQPQGGEVASDDVSFSTVEKVVKALSRIGHTHPDSQEEQAAKFESMVLDLCREVQSHFDQLLAIQPPQHVHDHFMDDEGQIQFAENAPQHVHGDGGGCAGDEDYLFNVFRLAYYGTNKSLAPELESFRRAYAAIAEKTPVRSVSGEDVASALSAWNHRADKAHMCMVQKTI